MAEWIIDDVLKATPEMIWCSTVEETRQRLVTSCTEVLRVELMAFENNRPVGFCVLVADDDATVGPCLGVMWNFVLPEHRGTVGARFLRRAVQIAKRVDLPVLAYTHRIGEGKYTVTYRRL